MAVDSSVVVHPTAIIEDGARIGPGTSVGAYSIIDRNVVLGGGNCIGPHVVITGNTVIGEGNEIFQFASIGAKPQDLKYKGEASRLEIGDCNKIREYVTLQPGTEGGGMFTRIGDKNLFMACAHVGHDGQVGNGNVFANSIALAGHVTVGDNVIVGGMAGIHQFVRLGDHAMLGAGSMVSKDVPPYCMAHGDRARLVGINHLGLRRAGWNPQDIVMIRKLFRSVFYGEGAFRERVLAAKEQYRDQPDAVRFLDFLLASERGIMPVRKRGAEECE